jgi:glycosyltransferase 2 family protein
MEFSKRRLAGLIVLIVCVSFMVIFWTVDVTTLRQLANFHPASLLGVLILIAAGMYFDALRLIRLSAISGEIVSLSLAFRVVFGNYFMALLTPGAAGGAVIQVLFLKRAGMPTGKATVVVLIRTILSIMFLVFCLPVVFFYDPQILPWFDRDWIVRAALLLVGVAITGMLMLRTRIADRLAVIIAKRLPTRWQFKVMRVYRDMRGALAMMSSSPVAMGRALLESALSLLALYAMVPVLFAGMGVELDWIRVMGRMIFLNLLLYFAPTPGGAGVAEGLFLANFQAFFPLGIVGIVAVAWRIFAEYLPACVGGYFTVKTFGMKKAQNKLSGGANQP